MLLAVSRFNFLCSGIKSCLQFLNEGLGEELLVVPHLNKLPHLIQCPEIIVPLEEVAHVLLERVAEDSNEFHSLNDKGKE